MKWSHFWIYIACRETPVCLFKASKRLILVRTHRTSKVDQRYVRHNLFIVLNHRLHVSTYIQVIFRPSYTGESIKWYAWWDPIMLTEIKYFYSYFISVKIKNAYRHDMHTQFGNSGLFCEVPCTTVVQEYWKYFCLQHLRNILHFVDRASCIDSW